MTYDIPSLNPFRDLIPLTREHAVLLHIAIANGASHLANLQSMEVQKASTTPTLSLANTAASEEVLSRRLDSETQSIKAPQTFIGTRERRKS